MNFQGWAEIAFTISLTVLGWPLGLYMARLWQGHRPGWIRPCVPWSGFYSRGRHRPGKGQGWLAYTLAFLAFNTAGFFALYAIFRLKAFCR